ncbi:MULTISPECIES: dihydropteroate synthase [Ectothiorhodospira]|nr:MULTISPECIES: dihydropteroate synthase [Ectothiorhodospira]MCG5493197.1 dihydropteroate synthase [Ectothiorhodospira variabilis]MCG5497081.1 dihydropteroate synthase [Ectothiorhodospira variabilis]MCG5502526.1 dihydropteroate synthase [Ectothiorhodospira variabilis]MCG5505708.1 dihydropteroate synthase [Ectothiorhodospira variabilis]MCG5525433.1 dihydropteroate synthase [Ectothiorhodospira haloalkaliphila]
MIQFFHGHGFVMQFGQYTIDLTQPRIMGILNVTPDSFSDGGAFIHPAQAIEHALTMVEEGADFIDVGGESTRPGAASVPVEEELTRVVPIIEALAPRVPVPISVDTSKAEVMRAACAAGATLINDVRALQDPGALEMAARCEVPVCLMHMQGQPRSMQVDPRYGDVVAEVRDFLAERVVACRAAGILADRLLLDPGFGFGKNLEHNLTLLRRLPELAVEGLPLLVGMSRKTMIGRMLGDERPASERIQGSVAAALLAAQQGASILRVHDVAATRDALRVLRSVGEPFIH